MQNITRPIARDDGCNLKQRPVTKNIIAAASHGFHMFQAQTENLSLKQTKLNKYINGICVEIILNTT